MTAAISAQPDRRGSDVSARTKPNILLIMCDQHGPWASGTYGHPFVQTPNIDGLARRGVTFDAAYCPSPICVPSRASFLTGLRVQRTGVWDNGVPMRSDLPTWAHYLSAAGYQTVLAGKQHFMGPDQLHGFETRFGKEIHTTRILPGGFYKDQKTLDDKGFDLRAWYRVAIGRIRHDDYDDEMEQHAIRFLEGEGRDPSRPFALCVSFIRPHFPLTVQQQDWDRYWPDHADLPSIPDGYFERMHPAWQALRRYYLCDTIDEEQTRRTRAAYYGLVTYADRKVGGVLSALGRSGLADNTVVIYTSDHGEHIGSRGLWWKASFFEESARVPLIVSWPGQFPQNERRKEVTSTVDVMATMLELGGTKPIEDLDGRSLGRVLRGSDPDWPDRAYSEYYTSGAPAPRCMLRQGKYKLNYFLNDRPELYDLEADPGEWHDLAGDPGHAAVLQELVATLRANWDGTTWDGLLKESLGRRALILKAESVYKGGLPAPGT